MWVATLYSYISVSNFQIMFKILLIIKWMTLADRPVWHPERGQYG